jgi:hypothetical protein
MKTLNRYLPLVLLAVFWEVAARLELVSSSALPSERFGGELIDLIKTVNLSATPAPALSRRRRPAAGHRTTVLASAWRSKRSTRCSA